jgi:hypothetical protein
MRISTRMLALPLFLAATWVPALSHAAVPEPSAPAVLTGGPPSVSTGIGPHIDPDG